MQTVQPNFSISSEWGKRDLLVSLLLLFSPAQQNEIIAEIRSMSASQIQSKLTQAENWNYKPLRLFGFLIDDPEEGTLDSNLDFRKLLQILIFIASIYAQTIAVTSNADDFLEQALGLDRKSQLAAQLRQLYDFPDDGFSGGKNLVQWLLELVQSIPKMFQSAELKAIQRNADYITQLKGLADVIEVIKSRSKDIMRGASFRADIGGFLEAFSRIEDRAGKGDPTEQDDEDMINTAEQLAGVAARQGPMLQAMTLSANQLSKKDGGIGFSEEIRRDGQGVPAEIGTPLALIPLLIKFAPALIKLLSGKIPLLGRVLRGRLGQRIIGFVTKKIPALVKGFKAPKSGKMAASRKRRRRRKSRRASKVSAVSNVIRNVKSGVLKRAPKRAGQKPLVEIRKLATDIVRLSRAGDPAGYSSYEISSTDPEWDQLDQQLGDVLTAMAPDEQYGFYADTDAESGDPAVEDALSPFDIESDTALVEDMEKAVGDVVRYEFEDDAPEGMEIPED